MAKKLKTTPVGVFRYPRLCGKPDTKFNDAGDWKVTLVLSNEDAAPILAEHKELTTAKMKEVKDELSKAAKTDKKAAEKLKKLKLADVSFKDGEEDGTTEITFKMKASGISKKDNTPWTRAPKLFDIKGKPITDNPRIGGGTKGKVSYELSPFATAIGVGCSFRLEAVQIIELVEWGADGAGYGFGDESDGEDEGSSTDAGTEAGAETTDDNEEF